MRKPYAAYLVVMTALCLIGLWGVVRVLDDANAKLVAMQSAGQNPEQSVPAVESAIAQHEAQLVANERAREVRASQEQSARIKAAMDAEAARINREIAARPRPVPVTGWAPGNKVSGRVYTNANIRPARKPPVAPPDVSGARLVIEMDPRYGTAELERLTRDKRLSCAAFSYQPEPGVTRNRVYCAQKGS
jgi:hypothetical protein